MNTTQSPVTIGNRQNVFLPIGSPTTNDAVKWKQNPSSPIQYSLPQHAHVIRPELVRPIQQKHPQQQHQHLPPPVAPVTSIGHATSVIRISPATSNNYHQVLPPQVIVDPTQLVPVIPTVEKGVPKNGLNQVSTYQWHTLLPIINSPQTTTVALASPTVSKTPSPVNNPPLGEEADDFVLNDEDNEGKL